VHYTVNAFNGFVEASRSSEISDKDELKAVSSIWSGLTQLLSFRCRSCRGSDAMASTQQLIYDMGTNETGCASDKNKLSAG